MTKDEALKLALEALETKGEHHPRVHQAITAIKEALAQLEQEAAATLAVRWHPPVGKVAYVLEVNLPVGIHKLYTSTPQRTWVGLTANELSMIGDSMKTWNSFSITDVYFAIETKLKELNT